MEWSGGRFILTKENVEYLLTIEGKEELLTVYDLLEKYSPRKLNSIFQKKRGTILPGKVLVDYLGYRTIYNHMIWATAFDQKIDCDLVMFVEDKKGNIHLLCQQEFDHFSYVEKVNLKNGFKTKTRKCFL